MSVLEVKDVSIRYKVGDFKDIGVKEYLIRKVKKDYHATEFWADRNITFSLEKGDMLGIIGTNGAGKIHPAEGGFRHYGAQYGQRKAKWNHRGAAGAGQRL